MIEFAWLQCRTKVVRMRDKWQIDYVINRLGSKLIGCEVRTKSAFVISGIFIIIHTNIHIKWKWKCDFW